MGYGPPLGTKWTDRRTEGNSKTPLPQLLRQGTDDPYTHTKSREDTLGFRWTFVTYSLSSLI